MAKSVLTVSKVEKLDVDYDEDADVLYISFGPPVSASDSRTLENDIIVRYKGERFPPCPRHNASVGWTLVRAINR